MLDEKLEKEKEDKDKQHKVIQEEKERMLKRIE